MPRAQASSKRQSGASVAHNSNRHDNGLVGPARRSTPKKSSNYQADSPGPARPTADHGSGCAGSASAAASVHDASARSSNSENGRTDQSRRASVGGCSETSSDSSSFPSLPGHGGPNGIHRSIDVNATKNVDVHKDSGPLELVTTVLKSLPLQDTIAILIILMHIPSVSLTLIYGLFAFLTFAPPVSGGSGVNVSLADLWEAISNTPSVITVAGMDFIFFLFWAFLWPPLQDTILDMAKPIIALTLGGAGGPRGTAPYRGHFACFGWIIVYHALRLTRAHWAPWVSYVPARWQFPALTREPFEADHLYDKKNYFDYLKSGFAIHILMQGMVRGIKDWYVRREKFIAAAGSGDPEVGKPAAGGLDHSAEPTVPLTEAEASSSTMTSSTTSKKKRKQSAHVRQQQPLWAALASTKIVFMKEYEFSNRSSASAGSNATDIHNLGNAPFDREPAQIWIAYIGSDEVSFSTSRFIPHDDDENDDDNENLPSSAANGHSKQSVSSTSPKNPFYVRVNNALWHPTRFYPLNDGGESSEGTRWNGDIYGLRPASKYVCEFVDSTTHEVLFTTTVRTAQETLEETDTSNPLPNGQPSQRPDSPATTLRNSIAVSDTKLADEKSRLKTARKEWKTKINSLKRDSDATDNQLSSAGSQDEKLRAKIRQQEQAKLQHEEETEELSRQIKNFDAAPELQDRKKKVERAYYAEKKIFDAAQKDFKDYKAKLDKEVSAKSVENTNLNTKRNKLATRIAKLESEIHNITDANNRGINEAERRKQERESLKDYQTGIDTYYRERLNTVRAGNAAKAEQVRSAQVQLHSFHDLLSSVNGLSGDVAQGEDGSQSQAHPAHWQMNPAAQPHFPSGMLANPAISTNANAGILSNALPMGYHNLPPTAPAFEPRGWRSRGRSSSMLSDVSGFTQSSDDEDSPGGWNGNHSWMSNGWPNGQRADSGSAGDSGGSNSGGEPTSPS